MTKPSSFVDRHSNNHHPRSSFRTQLLVFVAVLCVCYQLFTIVSEHVHNNHQLLDSTFLAQNDGGDHGKQQLATQVSELSHKIDSLQQVVVQNTAPHSSTASLHQVQDNNDDDDGPEPANLTPFNSKAPKPIDLFSVQDPVMVSRHLCIHSIRERQLTLLQPYIPNGGTTRAAEPAEAILLDPAYHWNVGDHMITTAEMEFMKRIGYPNLHKCNYVQASTWVQGCESSQFTNERVLPLEQHNRGTQVPSNTVLWHGGGNWGDLYPIMNQKRIPSFQYWLKRNYTVVGMPQSLHYKAHSTLKTLDARKITSIVRAVAPSATKDSPHSKLVLAWREQTSYDQAKELYPTATNLLVPDIAFQLGPYLPMDTPLKQEQKLDIVLLLRTDFESVLKNHRDNEGAIRKLLNQVPGGEQLKFNVVDWNSRLDMFHSKDKWFTKTAIQMLSMGKVVICDRLHASILCYLAGIPFVYIDQVTNKVTKTLSVAFDSSPGCRDGETAQWARAFNLPQALELAVGMMEAIDQKTNGKTSTTSGRTMHWGFSTPKPQRL